jgi:hypothetical protein
MAQIIQLRPKEEIGEAAHKEFYDNLAEKTDQLIYLSKDKEGLFSMGHTPLDLRDLMFMSYHLHKIIEHTILDNSGEPE